MKYVSIDLETTGLNPDKCQILEIGAVFNDDTVPLAACQVYHRLIYPPGGIFKGEAYALWMNAHILKEIHDLNTAKAGKDKLIENGDLKYQFAEWLYQLGYEKRDDKTAGVVAAGKNFQGFDLRFLRRYDVEDLIIFKHREINPGMYSHQLADDVPPDTAACLKRAGLEGSVKHRAVDDALDVCRLIRTHFGVPI